MSATAERVLERRRPGGRKLRRVLDAVAAPHIWVGRPQGEAPVVDPWDVSTVPWWALGVMFKRLVPGLMRQALWKRQQGLDIVVAGSVDGTDYVGAWEELCALVVRDFECWDIDWWRRNEPELMREVALWDPRAFCQVTDHRDDTNAPMVLEDFHVRFLRGIRQNKRFMGLLPWMHGKSALASGLVPLMDWAENPDCTQIRMYYEVSFCRDWSTYLMGLLEQRGPRNLIFPQLRKPLTAKEKQEAEWWDESRDGDASVDDLGVKHWATTGFDIGGKTVREPHLSFRPLTARGTGTGKRAWRVLADDIVTIDNAESEHVQRFLENKVRTGLLTMPSLETPQSPTRFGTRWGTAGIAGTLFTAADVGSVFYAAWQADESAVAMRCDVYPHRDSEARKEVLWERRRPWAWVEEQKGVLGPDAFNMRMRNIPSLRGGSLFRKEWLDTACDERYQFGELPRIKVRQPNGWMLEKPARCIIGFDPAKGRTGKFAKNPAIVVLAFPEDGRLHIVRWQRLRGYNQHRQRETIIEWATEYCCPVAVERNYDEEQYTEELRKMDGGSAVQVICHTTTKNKRDVDDGVQSFVPLFSNGMITVHTGGVDETMVRELREEWEGYPNGRFTDLVMATWVGKFQGQIHLRGGGQFGLHRPVPVPAAGAFIDIRHLKYPNTAAREDPDMRNAVPMGDLW